MGRRASWRHSLWKWVFTATLEERPIRALAMLGPTPSNTIWSTLDTDNSLDYVARALRAVPNIRLHERDT